MTDIEDNFKRVYNNGRVVSEEGYHQPESIGCSCSKTTRKGTYRDIVVEYKGLRYYFYHQTPVVVQLTDNRIFINNGGYTTKSTLDRINTHTPSKIEMSQQDDQWYLEVGDKEHEFNGTATVMLTEDPQIIID